MDKSYEFDPSELDGSSKDEEVTLDNWKPSEKTHSLIKSEWRQKQNDGHCNQQPGIDELKKINMHLKKKYPDHEIMDAFGISSETLVAIKRNRYSPVDGISLDNQSKIYKEFDRLEKKIDRIFDAFKFISDQLANKKKRKKEEDEEE